MSEDSIPAATEDYLALTADIVAAHVANNRVAVGELPQLIASVHAALAGLNAPPAEAEAPKREPAVSIRASIRPDYIVCLEDGAKLKMLKRYLRTNFDMTPDDYRKKWGLPSDYPMVAPNYAEKRRGLAHAIGLGRKAKAADAAPAEAAAPEPVEAPPAPKRRGRPPKSAAATPPPEAASKAPADETPISDAPADEMPAKPARKPRARKLSGSEALARARGDDGDA